jgi:hypothetical protein
MMVEPPGIRTHTSGPAAGGRHDETEARLDSPCRLMLGFYCVHVMHELCTGLYQRTVFITLTCHSSKACYIKVIRCYNDKYCIQTNDYLNKH